MTQVQGFEGKVGFIWSVADLLRGDFKAHEYGQVILPFTVLRRLECALEPTKEAVLKRATDLRGKVENVDPSLRRAAKHSFYNVSPLDLSKILNDPGNAGPNLRQYLAGFSPGAREVLERYGFDEKITRLDRAGLLYQVVAKFAEIDLTERAVPNEAMGYIFEELLRRFSEMSNETAGEHFTPRDVVRLMVNILFAEDDEVLAGIKPVRTMYDPACGTGGMLSVSQDHLRELNPDAVLEVFGQEINPETWAVCRSDMMLKGEDPTRIVLGNSFTEDGHEDRRFDYMLANPPFGVDWKKYAEPIKREHEKLGFDGRFGPGLPRVSDGSLLFLLHMLSKMKPAKTDPVAGVTGGTRLAIVFSGSPLFAGAAGGGESETRRWIIENDWLEGIIALPDQMFYNTGISTYFWVLTNRKRPERRGKIALVDARNAFAKMRKSLGNKRNYIPDDAIAEVTRLYAEAIERADDDPRVKVFPNETFGYQRITIERPLRRRWELSDDVLADLPHHKQWVAWLVPPKHHPDPAAFTHQAEADQERLLDVLRGLIGQSHEKEAAFKKALIKTLDDAGLHVPDKLLKAIIAEAAVPDPDAPVITDRRGNPLPDPDLRDQENIPLGEDPEDYLRREVLPYAPDAWIDHTKTKIGYEIPFTRHFYFYQPPRPLAEIDAELADTEARVRELFERLAR